MALEDPRDLKGIDQEIRINELKAEAEELAGGEMTTWENPDCPPDIAERFWEHVVAYEKAPRTSHFQMLSDRGVELPPPDELSDEALHAKLWELIHALAEMQTFLVSTDHYNDRELYEHLWYETLHEVTIEPLPGITCTLDLVSSGSEEDIENYLRYYADDESRAHWKESYPGDAIPPREKPPYDRDRQLPKG